MPMLQIVGDPEVMGRIKTDSKTGSFHWSVDLTKAISRQHGAVDNLKKTLNAYYGSGKLLEGACVLHLCTASKGKGAVVDLDKPLAQQGVKNGDFLYAAKPPPPPPEPKPKPARPPAVSVVANQPPLQVQIPQQSAPPIDYQFGAAEPAMEQHPPPAPALVMAAPVAPIDWDRFIDFWEAQADKEMATL
eukprot:TRINITY_DN2611_c0_g1_i1.p1 TRINITY_DN2611_c0_g1~~TRINITY_DN2611_c0_g1_i1.p1  ORF type:complete len:218 (+),score=61.89 TRINITY_DN2611_c0_g1_i1:88-654(+)